MALIIIIIIIIIIIMLNKYFIAQPKTREKQNNWAKFHLYPKPKK